MKTPEYKRQVAEMTAKAEQEIAEMRDKIAEVEKISSEQSITIEAKLEKLSEYDEDMKRLKREIDDLWKGMYALSNPLS
mgnify:CR=1 FL=1